MRGELNRRDFLRVASLAASALLPEVISNSKTPVPQKIDASIQRILLLADLHLGQTDINPRQANSYTAKTLTGFVDKLSPQEFDLFVQLGDMISDSSDKQTCLDNLKTNLEISRNLPLLSIYLLGNHDLWNLSLEEINQVFEQEGVTPQFYGIKDFDNHQIVWLDLVAPPGQHGYLPSDRIDWLRSTIDPKKPIILFSHYGFFPQDPDGSYYFKSHSIYTALQNGPLVWRRLRDLPIQAVISGHIHWGSYSKVDNTHMITLPSFTENIASDNQHFNPGIYSILELKDEHLVLKSFFNNFCFFNVQI
jgi:predicted MPP superfamily phosphohydrolase